MIKGTKFYFDGTLASAFTLYVIHLRNKLNLLYEFLTFLQIQDNKQKFSVYVYEYKHLKKIQLELCNNFHNIIEVDKHLLNNFKTNVLDSFENFYLNLRTNNKPQHSNNYDLIIKLKMIFVQSELIDSVNITNLDNLSNCKQSSHLQKLVNRLIEEEQIFMVLYIKRILNHKKIFGDLINQFLCQIRKNYTQNLINEVINEGFINETKLNEGFNNETKTKILYESIRMISRSRSIKKNESSPLPPFGTKSSDCNCCKVMNIMQIMNLNQVYHNRFKKTEIILLKELYRLNNQIKKDIVSFVNSKNNKSKSIFGDKLQYRFNQTKYPGQIIKKLSLTRSKQLQSFHKNKQILNVYSKSKQLQGSTVDSNRRPQTQITEFDKVWSSQKRKLRQNSRQKKQSSETNRTLFPKLI